jgi:hypothetical protein
MTALRAAGLLILVSALPAHAQSLSVSIAVTPEEILLGSGFLLMWASHPPSSTCVMTVGNWSGQIPTSGADWTTPSVAGAITYLISCISPSGKGTMTASATVTVLPLPPTSALELAWTDNADNEQGVIVERQTEPETIYREIARVGVDGVTYRDEALSRGVRYCYQVRSFNAVGSSAASNQACAIAP